MPVMDLLLLQVDLQGCTRDSGFAQNLALTLWKLDGYQPILEAVVFEYLSKARGYDALYTEFLSEPQVRMFTMLHLYRDSQTPGCSFSATPTTEVVSSAYNHARIVVGLPVEHKICLFSCLWRISQGVE